MNLEAAPMYDELPPAYYGGELHVLAREEAAARISLSHDGLVDINEELPGYSEANLPIYEEPPSTPSIVSFTIRQSNRKLRAIIPSSETTRFPSYLMVGRSGPRLLSRKPDFRLTRIAEDISRSSSTSSDDANPTNKKGVGEIAHLDVTSNASFPWMPRACITHFKTPLVAPQTFALAAPNFSDFHFELGDKNYVWKLSDHPTTSLVLVERTCGNNGDRIVARFSYSAFGADAVKGQEVGNLEIFEIPDDSSDEDGEQPGFHAELEWIELVIGGMALVIQYWKAMGKSFRNSTRPSRCSYGVRASEAAAGGGTSRADGFGAYGF